MLFHDFRVQSRFVTKKQWNIASVLSVLAILAIVGLSFWQQSGELEKARQEAQAAHSEAREAAARAAALSNDVAQIQNQVAALQQEKEAAITTQKSIEDSMKTALESKDVTISQLQGKLTVNILDRILFDSGEASLKPEGEKVLRQIASVLSKYPHRQIHVIGHTDDVPIRLGARARFPSNWELSTARANAAVRFLCESAGVDPTRLAAVGYGEYHPVAENSTDEGKAKNRRIELVVLPEELSKMLPVTNVAPSVPINVETNPPSPQSPPSTNLTTDQPIKIGRVRPGEPGSLSSTNGETAPFLKTPASAEKGTNQP